MRVEVRVCVRVCREVGSVVEPRVAWDELCLCVCVRVCVCVAGNLLASWSPVASATICSQIVLAIGVSPCGFLR